MIELHPGGTLKAPPQKVFLLINVLGTELWSQNMTLANSRASQKTL